MPDAHRNTAYMDRSIALVGGKTEPAVATALMLQAAEVAADDKVLLVGAPNGYVATLLSARANS